MKIFLRIVMMVFILATVAVLGWFANETYRFAKGMTQDRACLFSLERDLTNFSNAMLDSDTLEIFSNLSVCCGIHFEHDIITKEREKVFIQTYAKGFLADEWEVELPKREYRFLPEDSLNLENLFQHMQNLNTPPNRIYAKTFKIKFRNDSIEFYSNGLGEQVPNATYFIQIKRRIYPEADIYKPVEVPEPPIPEFAGEDEINSLLSD